MTNDREQNVTPEPGGSPEPTDLHTENRQLRELVELEYARNTILELELQARRDHDPDAVHTVAWTLIEHTNIRLDKERTHIHWVLEHADGTRYSHDHVIHGDGPGMTGVTTIAQC